MLTFLFQEQILTQISQNDGRGKREEGRGMMAFFSARQNFAAKPISKNDDYGRTAFLITQLCCLLFLS